MHAVISLLLQSRKFWWYLLLSSLMLLHDIIMTSCWRHSVFTCLQCLLIYFSLRKIMEFIDKDKILYQKLAWFKTVLGVRRQKKLMKEFSLKCWSKKELSCSIMSTRDKSIVWMNWNGSSSMSGAASNSWFLTRLLNCGEEDFEHVSVLKEELVNWQRWFCPYLLHSVWIVWLQHL